MEVIAELTTVPISVAVATVVATALTRGGGIKVGGGEGGVVQGEDTRTRTHTHGRLTNTCMDATTHSDRSMQRAREV